MAEPAYVAIAGEYARRIRAGELPPRTQLPSYSEIAKEHDVSDIVVRKAVELLQSQGLVRSMRRRGVFVADQLNLVRVSPERQMEDPEATFSGETVQDVHVERDVERVPATEALVETFAISPADEVLHTVTRASEGRRPISISDTYQPLDVVDTATAVVLEESLTDQLPTPMHSEWLQTTPGEMVKTIRQRFLDADGRVIMLSDVSYSRDRYDTFVFRMTLDQGN